VHARAVLLRLLVVAHPASLGHRLTELLGIGRQRLVRIAVANTAVRSRFISGRTRLPVHTARIFTGHLRVALSALRLGNARRMRKRLVPRVACRTIHFRVGAGLNLFGLVVTRRAIGALLSHC
jgi:hypothetical protein